jgi:hypothetical protein
MSVVLASTQRSRDQDFDPVHGLPTAINDALAPNTRGRFVLHKGYGGPRLSTLRLPQIVDWRKPSNLSRLTLVQELRAGVAAH